MRPTDSSILDGIMLTMDVVRTTRGHLSAMTKPTHEYLHYIVPIKGTYSAKLKIYSTFGDCC